MVVLVQLPTLDIVHPAWVGRSVQLMYLFVCLSRTIAQQAMGTKLGTELDRGPSICVCVLGLKRLEVRIARVMKVKIRFDRQ